MYTLKKHIFYISLSNFVLHSFYVHTIYYTFSVHITLYSVPVTLYMIYWRDYSIVRRIPRIPYIIRRTVYNVRRVLYGIQCIVYTACRTVVVQWYNSHGRTLYDLVHYTLLKRKWWWSTYNFRFQSIRLGMWWIYVLESHQWNYIHRL